MTKKFYQLTLEEFDNLLRRFEFQRRILSVHLHHTWRPNKSQFAGINSLESIWRYHTGQNRLGDIAAQLYLAPDGSIWTGRSWNWAPASVRGNNGSPAAGPFMISLVGDFDRGADTLEAEQRAALVGVVARLQQKCGLPAESLLFHGDLTGGASSCPGSSLNYQHILEQLQGERDSLSQQQSQGLGAWASQGSEYRDPRLEQILWEWSMEPPGLSEEESAEHDEAGLTPQQERIMTGQDGATQRAPAGRGGGDDELTPEMLAELRPHVINLNQGRFSEEGLFRTSQADVDAIFDDHLEAALARAQTEVDPANRKLRLLIWAHGGLIPEKAGLTIAALQVAWWKQNKVYPVFFVWETGFCDALKLILSGARAPAGREIPRDLWDYTTDPAIEAVARTLGGAKIWGAMKRSARLASGDGGGAAYAAQRLAQFCARHPDQVVLHAAGHSAGSIFHAHFLPVAFDLGVPSFTSLSFLAPALRVDEFKERLMPLVGEKIQRLVMYTMKRDWEEHDNVATVYRKSLLCLIYWALEPERKEPIVGLESSARSDDDLVGFFGLKGTPAPHAEVVWSKTLAQTGRSASTSASHGGFDNDRPTMNSVLRRIVDRDDIIDFPESAMGRGLGDIWDKAPELPPEFSRLFAWTKLAGPPPTPPSPEETAGPGEAAPSTGTGARKALCIGINKYPAAPLSGCVTDALSWGGYFQGQGYQVSYLKDEEATRGAILDNLERMIVGSKAGDRVLFQYSGHGTELDDIDGDEQTGTGTNGPKDEALCPYDYASGAFVIDDDIAEVFAKIPPEVSVTCFIDCCHSGTITRFMVGGTAGTGASLVPRFIVASPEMNQSHRQFRSAIGVRGLTPGRRPENMRQVVYSACRDSEVAYESNGQGEFTVRALQVLRRGVAGLSYEAVLSRVVAAFGPNPRQHPELDCNPAVKGAPLVM
jgi:hypothetical protein